MIIQLSPRQRQIVLLLAEGCSNKQIAKAMRISEFTVKSVLETLRIRTDTPNRTAIVTYCFRHGLIE